VKTVGEWLQNRRLSNKPIYQNNPYHRRALMAYRNYGFYYPLKLAYGHGCKNDRIWYQTRFELESLKRDWIGLLTHKGKSDWTQEDEQKLAHLHKQIRECKSRLAGKREPLERM